jgi:SNF2 family DNA or RNA helicase
MLCRRRLISSRHFRASSVEVLVYYGQGRQKHCKFFNNYDIILTTYNSVSLDWKLQKFQRQEKNARSLFSTYWHRVILDEGEDSRLQHEAR